MNNVQKGEFLLAAIMAGASTPNGFAIADHPKEISFAVTQNRCNALVKAGTLFKVKPPAGYVHYFTTKEAMQAFRAKFSSRPVMAVAEKRAANPQLRPEVSVTRQPTPNRTAEIVHTDKTRYSSRSWADPRAVSVPFVRIGQPGFAMRVGGAA